jgi:hypothetical protein
LAARAACDVRYLTVMLEGKYTDAFLAFAGKNAPNYTAEDLGIVSSPIDFVGLNVYTPNPTAMRLVYLEQRYTALEKEIANALYIRARLTIWRSLTLSIAS